MHGQGRAPRTGAVSQEPTRALPGTEQKIRVMTERASRREQLFHPEDGFGSQVLAPGSRLVAAPLWEPGVSGPTARPSAAPQLDEPPFAGDLGFDAGADGRGPIDQASKAG